MICPDCGQTLPESGTCYNCIKNKNDAKRYGRGSGILPAYLKYGLAGNISKPTTSSRPRPIKKSPAQRKRAGRPRIPRKKAPIKRNRSHRLSRSRSAGQVERSVRPLHGASLIHQRQGVNNFLKAVYQQPMLISEVLTRRGFSDRQIKAVKEDIANYFVLLVTAWCNSWRHTLTPQQIVIVTHFYSFKGQPPGKLGYLAQTLKTPIERVRKDLEEAILKLRLAHHKKHIDRSIYDAAKKLLQNTGAS